MPQIAVAYDRSPSSIREYFEDTRVINSILRAYPDVLIKIGYQALAAYRNGGPEKEPFLYSYGELMRGFVHACGGKVLWDLKYEDIRNTMAKGIENLAGMVGGLTVHANRRAKVLAELVEARDKAAGVNPTKKLALIGVTLLTDIDEDECLELYDVMPAVMVERRARNAFAAGFDGIVCSGQELELINRLDPDHKRTRVVPATRPAWADADDQKRVMLPREAADLGADILVFGRPVWTHRDPVEAVGLLREEVCA